jgi:hypothetical protein
MEPVNLYRDVGIRQKIFPGGFSRNLQRVNFCSGSVFILFGAMLRLICRRKIRHLRNIFI